MGLVGAPLQRAWLAGTSRDCEPWRRGERPGKLQGAQPWPREGGRGCPAQREAPLLPLQRERPLRGAGAGGDLGLPCPRSLAHWLIHSLTRPFPPPASLLRQVVRGPRLQLWLCPGRQACRGRSAGLLQGQGRAGRQQETCPPPPCSPSILHREPQPPAPAALAPW